MDKEYYSVKEFADKLGLHPNTVRRAIKRNIIYSLRLTQKKNSRHRIPHNELFRATNSNLEEIIENEVKRRISEKK